MTGKAKRIAVALLVSAFWVTAAAAQTDQAGSAVNDHIGQFRKPDLDVGMWLERLEDPYRDVIEHRDGVITALRLKPGQHVADVGAGTGPYMEGISRIVGEAGRYYGVDIAPAFIGYMRDRAAKVGLNNVTLIVSRIDHATLPPRTVDVVVLVNTYHLLDPVKPMLDSLFEALKPDGTLVIVDFDRIEGHSRKWILDHIRADKNTFRKEIEAAGFRFVEQATDAGLEHNFFFRFAKSK